jgi:hypothetical protein
MTNATVAHEDTTHDFVTAEGGSMSQGDVNAAAPIEFERRVAALEAVTQKVHVARSPRS